MIILKTQSEDTNNIGSKAANLLLLEKSGFRVPASVVLTADYILDNKNDLAKLLLKNCLFIKESLFAVRSSSCQEDLQDASFAGQYKTLLNISMKELESAVQTVSDSNNSKLIETYCKNMGKEKSLPPAVLIQPMLKATVSGIAFSRHPVTGEAATFITCTAGLGEKLASGEISGSTYKVKRNQIEVVDNSEFCSISLKQLKEIDRLARRINRRFGCPQDIEWVYVGKKLYVLQARPITTLKKYIFDNSNIAESYPGISLPLTFSLARKAYANVYVTFLHLIGVSQETIDRNAEMFPQMLAYIKGRIYYNLQNWYRLLSLLPGYKSNRVFMEQMMGVSESTPDGAKGVSGWKDQLSLIWCAILLLIHYINLDKLVAKFKSRLNETLDLANKSLEAKNVFDYVSTYQEVESKLLKRWDAPILNDFYTMVSFGVLKLLAKDGNYNQLLVGRYKTSSSEPVEMLNTMAGLAALNKPFDKLFDEYLEKYGDRCAGELKLENPTLKDNPTLLLDSIVALSKKSHIHAEFSMIDLKVYELDPLKRLLLKFALDNACRHLGLRESMRFDRMRVFALVRKIFLSIANGLVAQNVLKETQDIFYLEIDEVIQYLQGTSTVSSLQNLADLRKTEIDSFKSQVPRSRIETTTCIQWHDDIYEKALSVCSGSSLKGQGCSAGIVRGRVKVLLNPESESLDGYDILVAQRTDPGWITHIAQAKAVIVEYGNMLSHTAVVCRELGIASIVSVRGLTNNLQTGDLVEIDGSTGSIIILVKDPLESAA